ncbi:histidine phosphotransferase family protein [Croceibacterium sp. TMG7-5b_MA50]|uniref:histidine phosphotransferase family protein n=1 Tax=Croceibacterium sp. TMG7-5b_MA50 TaxID=3121290 RepID=UPI00322165F5
MDAEPDLAALLASRLCHDLVSPVAAFGNGLELLETEHEPAMRESCVALLRQSAEASAAKLGFFRYAFGAAGAVQEMPAAELYGLITALAATGRPVQVEWAVAADTLPGAAAKLLLNMAGIGLDALARGGVLAVAAERQGATVEIAVRAEGARVTLDRDVARVLDGTLPPHQLSSRTAQAALVRQLAEAGGGNVQHAQDDGVLVLGAMIGGSGHGSGAGDG